MFDCIVVGAGISGSVIARQLAETGKEVLVIEQRQHIGGNSFDFVDKNGLIIHKYGPHIFHTDSKLAFDFLSRFTDWNLYQHRVLVSIDGKKVPLPFNLDSIESLFPRNYADTLEQKLIMRFDYGSRVVITDLLRESDQDLQFLGRYVFEKIYKNYTLKQWGLSPDKLSSEVTARVPIIVSRDDRYFPDSYQGVPIQGYTKLFERMLNHKRIHLLLNANARQLLSVDVASGKIYFLGNEFKGLVFYTGALDELLDYAYGRLDYRSLEFAFETIETEWYQEVATINYPNEYDFTRITEFKHFYRLDTKKTVILKEYPKAYNPGEDVPCYPILSDQTRIRYHKYVEAVEKVPNLIPLGRLAEFRYYDMDDAVIRALQVFEELS